MRRLFIVLVATAAAVSARRVVVYDRSKPKRVSVVEKRAAEGENETDDRATYRFAARAFTTALLDSVRTNAVAQNGSGTAVYLLDSGCELTHPAFAQMDVRAGPSFVPGEPDSGIDVEGHGTHVTGIAVQIAPGASFTCVRVFSASGSGTVSGLALAVDWVASECLGKRRRCIINLSGGGGSDPVLDRIANDVVALDGVAFVAAAGNGFVDACTYSPGRAARVIGVAATSVSSKPVFAAFSAGGACVKALAPGQLVWSSIPPASYAYMSGTSMAAPVVTGALARWWQANPWLSAPEITALLLANTRSVVANLPPLTTNAFVSLPTHATLNWIEAGPAFEEWRAEWAAPLCLDATSESAAFHFALSQSTDPLPLRSATVSANGKTLRVAGQSVSDHPDIRRRRVAIESNGTLTVSAFYRDRLVPMLSVDGGAQAMRGTFAAGNYTSIALCDVVAFAEPPCDMRLSPATCVGTCKWLGACRDASFCGFLNRNVCVAMGCAWKKARCGSKHT